MLSLLLVVASLGQCPGGSCGVSQPAYSMPRFYYAPVAPQPAAQLWQLADRTGQVWQHTDPVYLQAWVTQRNGLTLMAPIVGR